MAALTSGQRRLLRLHYVDGLSMDEAGRPFGVNRSTIFRRLSTCTEALLERIRDRIPGDLGITTNEIDSLTGALMSDFELSLGEFLKPLT
jgi:RNA polymerase sigma-70 factor (ECF subfamily)